MPVKVVLVFSLALIASASVLWGGRGPAGALGNVTAVLDRGSGGVTGQYASMTLDGLGNPVISYHHDGPDAADLKLLRCGNPTCTSGNSEQLLDVAGSVGYFTSLKLDEAGNPVISYWDVTNGNLKLLHCGDPACASGNTVASPDTEGVVGMYTSLEIDAAGRPVVSYQDATNGDLKVLRCGSADCLAGNVVTSADTSGVVGEWTSLALDPVGNPVVSYFDVSNGNLKVLHCGDATCTAGNSLASPDTEDTTGTFTSIVLDAAGNPVVSYYDYTEQDLNVLHCGNSTCTDGNVVATPDSLGDVGKQTNITLDAVGNPVVSHHDASNGDLRVVHCGNPTCQMGNVVGSPDTEGLVGFHSTVQVAADGGPVVAYLDAEDGDLKLLRCGDPHCSVGNAIATPDHGVPDIGSVGWSTSLALDANGVPVIGYHDFSNGALKVVRCGNQTCSSGNAVATPDRAGFVGRSTSLVLDGSGYPVVSYEDVTNQKLKVLHCGTLTCLSSNEVATPDSGPGGAYSSLVLDGEGYPVISHHDPQNGDLKLVHCNDPNCSGGDESITTPDSGGIVGLYTSLALDGLGNPVVSYQDETSQDLKLLHCNDPACAGADESITVAGAGAVEGHTSLDLDALGRPVISYAAGGDLKVLRCGDPNCAMGNSIQTPHAGSGPRYTSLKLDAAGNPIVSYWSFPAYDLNVLQCGDASCASGNVITVPDAGFVGGDTSLALDSTGRPVISYRTSGLDWDLAFIRCADPACTGVKYKDPLADTDGDTVPNAADLDDDSDGCNDTAEQQPEAAVASGGFRDPHNFWDFFDTPNASNIRDGDVSGLDFFALLGRFNTTGNPAIDPLSVPPPGAVYHTAFDRGPTSGPRVWNLTAANGAISGLDFFAMLGQFSHSCA